MTRTPEWVRGAGRRPRYVGVGRCAPLYRWIDDLPGYRGALERLAVASVGRAAPRRRVTDDVILDSWARVERLFPHVRDALLIYTGFYKDSVLSGVVRAESTVFAKVFRDRGAHEDEARRAARLAEVAPERVRLPSLLVSEDGLVAYELIEHASRAPHDQMQALALELGARGYRRAAASGPAAASTWEEVVVRTLKRLAELDVRLPSHADQALTDLPLERPVAHGDFTTWNVFLDGAGEAVLVDFDHVGEAAPFADAWHLATQPLVLRGRGVVPVGLVERVSAAAECARRTAAGWYAAYLVESLDRSTHDWLIGGRRYKRLRRAIEARARLLESVLEHSALT